MITTSHPPTYRRYTLIYNTFLTLQWFLTLPSHFDTACHTDRSTSDIGYSKGSGSYEWWYQTFDMP
jgi:hypothetical protein